MSELRVRPAPDRRQARMPVTIGIVLAVLAAAAAAWEIRRLVSGALGLAGPYTFLDLQVYRAGVHAWATGQALYSGSYTDVRLPFTYPPFGVVALSLAALGTLRQAAAVLSLLDGLLLVVCAWACVRASIGRFDIGRASIGRSGGGRSAGGRSGAGRSGAGRLTVLAVALGFAAVLPRLEPVTATVGFGQVNVVLCALVVVDALLVPPRYRGILSGLATAVKLTPAVFVLYFLLSGQRRAAGRQIVATIAASVLAVAAAPGSSWRFWTSLVVSNRVGPAWYTSNQSFRGVVSRIFGPGHAATLSWLVLSLLATVVAAVAIRRAHLAGAEVTALGMCALLGLLVSPISWSHHWVWSLPALLSVLCDRVHRVVRAFGLVFGVVLWVGPEWDVPNMENRELHWVAWQHLVGNLNVWLAVVLLVLVAVTAHHGRRPRQDSNLRPTD